MPIEVTNSTLSIYGIRLEKSYENVEALEEALNLLLLAETVIERTNGLLVIRLPAHTEPYAAVNFKTV